MESSAEGTTKRRSTWIWVTVAMLVGAAVTWRYVLRSAEPPPPVPQVATNPVPAAKAPSMPPSAEADRTVQGAVAGLSSAPGWAAWLKEGDLARRFVSAVNSVAEGMNPRASLSFLAPAKPFSVVHHHRHAFIDSASYHRFDSLADIVSSIDPKAAAGAYRTVHGLLQTAYSEISKSGMPLDNRLAEAFQTLEAPVPQEAPVEVVPHGIGWQFARSDLERLPAAGKSLLRMGPRNMKIIQSKVRELATELQLAPLAASAASSRHRG
jgi:hypothetical protein